MNLSVAIGVFSAHAGNAAASNGSLNLLLDDIYHGQRILKEGIIPAEQVLANQGYQMAMQGLDLHRSIYPTSPGSDLMLALVEHMPYSPGPTGVTSTGAQALARRAGGCQDHSHAFLACARSLAFEASVSPTVVDVMSMAPDERWVIGAFFPISACQLSCGRGSLALLYIKTVSRARPCN